MQKKLNHQTLINLILLAAAAFLLCWLFVFRDAPFGSKVDWISQHSVLPGYFRQRFYETKDLFPDFAANIGGGQNIYNFAYYGLFSPIILFSYLLPFIPMDFYIMGASIFCLAASVMLIYVWLSTRYSERICLAASLVLLLAAPMIYHSYNQLMFVNYMPFLLMALIGTDCYFYKKKSRLLTAGIFLMILTSFYFSIGGILAVILYGIFVYMEIHPSIKAKQFIVDGLRFARPVICAVLLSSFYLVPLFMTLINSRTSQASWSILRLLLPDLPVTRLLYSPYGLGLTALALIALLLCLSAKGNFRFLAGSLLLFLSIPLFGCLLNGGLYLKDKAFLPLLPLMCLLIAEYVHRLEHTDKNWRPFIYCHIITLLYLLILQDSSSIVSKYGLYMIADVLLASFCFFIYIRTRKLSVIILPLLVLMTLYGFLLNTMADMKLDPAFYNKTVAQSTVKTIADIQKETPGLYRIEQYGTPSENAASLNRIHTDSQWISSMYSSIYNKDYMKFRVNTFGLNQPFRNCLMQSATINPVFLDFMGIRYIVTTDNNIYANTDAAPVFYTTSQYMSETQYHKLTFPYNQTALLSYAVISDEEAGNGHTAALPPLIKFKSSDFKLPAAVKKNNQIRRTSDGYHITLSKAMTVQLTLPENSKNTDTVFIRFHIKNNKKRKDIAITIENERNKLTAAGHPYYNDNDDFTYVCPLKEGQKALTVKLGSGDYSISDIEYFAGAASAYSDSQLYKAIFHVDEKKTKGDTISGSITCQSQEYFITSIPYDKGFQVLVDGRQIPVQKVNTAFIGFPLDKGEHQITVTYTAEGAKTGRLLSILFIFLLCFISVFLKGNAR